MGKVLTDLILAALLGWLWWLPALNVDCREAAEWGRQEEGEPKGEAQTEQAWSRSVFSAYIVGGLDCMDDGSYEEYVKEQAHVSNRREGREQADRSDAFPRIYLKFMGLDLTDCIDDKGKTWKHKAFCSDEFYMEYPWDWYVGSTDACPLTFVPEWENEASGEVIRDWVDYFDENLEGSTGEVQSYIEGGGIDGFLEEVMGKPVTEEYEFTVREKDSDWLLIYDLKKGDKEMAEIVVWCNLGKISVRNWDVELTVEPQEDYGRILVFQEWDTMDFSSEEAIEAYVESADFLYRLLGSALEEDVEHQIISFKKKSVTTFYHTFVAVEVGIYDFNRPERLLRQAEVYIPVTALDQSNWVVVFESFPGSRREEGVANAQVRERVISTFVALPYYHRVKKGENLSVIAEQYGEDPKLAIEIAAWGPNQIRQPDLIYPGQNIQIPLGVLFRRIHH